MQRVGVLLLDCGSIKMELFPTFKSWKQGRKVKKSKNPRIQQKGCINECNHKGREMGLPGKARYKGGESKR